MPTAPSLISTVADAPRLAPCELCGNDRADLHEALVVQLASGAQVRFASCDRCVRAVRRITAASGGLARFALGLPPPRIVRPIPAGRRGIQRQTELIYQFAEGLHGDDGL